MKLLSLILSLVLFSTVASADGQLVITESGFKSRMSYTLTVKATDTTRECIVVATRISNAKHAYDSTMVHSSGIHQTKLGRTSLDYLCLHENGYVMDTGTIWQIPWQGQTMCLYYSEWNGMSIKDECERIWASRSLVLELNQSLRDYVKEWE